MSDRNFIQSNDLHSVTIIFNEDGTACIHGISILEELWDDYHFFKDRALETSPQENLILYKRYVRAALIALFNYLEGIVNKWVIVLEPSTDIRFKSIGSKIGIIRQAILKQGKVVEWLPFKKQKELRDAISHLKPSEAQFVIFQTLTKESFFAEADQIINWIETTKISLGLESHPNMQNIVDKVSAELQETE